MQQQQRSGFGLDPAENAQKLRYPLALALKLQRQGGFPQFGLPQGLAQCGQPVFIGLDGPSQCGHPVFRLDRLLQPCNSRLQISRGLRRIFGKIKDFITRVGNWLRGQGFPALATTSVGYDHIDVAAANARGIDRPSGRPVHCVPKIRSPASPKPGKI